MRFFVLLLAFCTISAQAQSARVSISPERSLSSTTKPWYPNSDALAADVAVGDDVVAAVFQTDAYHLRIFSLDGAPLFADENLGHLSALRARIAYGDGTFLVFWLSDRAVCARRVSPAGEWIDPEPIELLPLRQWEFAVDATWSDGRWLVAVSRLTDQIGVVEFDASLHAVREFAFNVTDNHDIFRGAWFSESSDSLVLLNWWESIKCRITCLEPAIPHVALVGPEDHVVPVLGLPADGVVDSASTRDVALVAWSDRSGVFLSRVDEQGTMIDHTDGTPGLRMSDRPALVDVAVRRDSVLVVYVGVDDQSLNVQLIEIGETLKLAANAHVPGAASRDAFPIAAALPNGKFFVVYTANDGESERIYYRIVSRGRARAVRR